MVPSYLVFSHVFVKRAIGGSLVVEYLLVDIIEASCGIRRSLVVEYLLGDVFEVGCGTSVKSVISAIRIHAGKVKECARVYLSWLNGGAMFEVAQDTIDVVLNLFFFRLGARHVEVHLAELLCDISRILNRGLHAEERIIFQNWLLDLNGHRGHHVVEERKLGSSFLDLWLNKLSLDLGLGLCLDLCLGLLCGLLYIHTGVVGEIDACGLNWSRESVKLLFADIEKVFELGDAIVLGLLGRELHVKAKLVDVLHPRFG